jgi:hypothetical protein
MKFNARGFAALENVIREHLKKHKEDDENATASAVRLPLETLLGDVRFAQQMLELPLRHQIFLKVRIELLGLRGPSATGGLVPKPQPKPTAPAASAAPLPAPEID